MKDQIKQVQKYVGVVVDGDFGPKTTQAVASKLNVASNLKSIQTALGVVSDGVLGPITLKAMLDKFHIKETVSVNGMKIVDVAKTQLKVQIEQIQKHLGIKVDGVVGPITIKAIADKLDTFPSVKAIQTALGVKADSVIGPITLKALLDKFHLKETVSVNGMKIVDVAKTQLKVRESGGNNQGEELKKYWPATNYPEGYSNREPWCAAFISWCIREANIFTEKERPKTASAFAYENWSDNLPSKTKITRKPVRVKKGQIVVFSFSHIGIATSDSDKNGNFETIEANTGASGSRDGDGVYEKTRNINVVRSVITIL